VTIRTASDGGSTTAAAAVHTIVGGPHACHKHGGNTGTGAALGEKNTSPSITYTQDGRRFPRSNN